MCGWGMANTAGLPRATRASAGSRRGPYAPPAPTLRRLYPYQREAVSWLWDLYRRRRGGVRACPRPATAPPPPCAYGCGWKEWDWSSSELPEISLYDSTFLRAVRPPPRPTISARAPQILADDADGPCHFLVAPPCHGAPEIPLHLQHSLPRDDASGDGDGSHTGDNGPLLYLTRSCDPDEVLARELCKLLPPGQPATVLLILMDLLEQVCHHAPGRIA